MVGAKPCSSCSALFEGLVTFLLTREYSFIYNKGHQQIISRVHSVHTATSAVHRTPLYLCYWGRGPIYLLGRIRCKDREKACFSLLPISHANGEHCEPYMLGKGKFTVCTVYIVLFVLGFGSKERARQSLHSSAPP